MKDFIKGIDISSYQPSVDFSKAKKEGVEFCFIKITEGTSRKDSALKLALSQAQLAQQAGLKIGYYHFASGNQPAAEQANYLKRVYSQKQFPKPDFPIILDLEDTNYSKLPLGRDLEKFVLEFDKTLSECPFLPKGIILYSYVPYLNTHLFPDHKLGNFPLWIAAYPYEARKFIDFSTPELKRFPPVPTGWKKYIGWQFTGRGTVPFNKGNIDLNVMSKEFF